MTNRLNKIKTNLHKYREAERMLLTTDPDDTATFNHYAEMHDQALGEITRNSIPDLEFLLDVVEKTKRWSE